MQRVCVVMLRQTFFAEVDDGLRDERAVLLLDKKKVRLFSVLQRGEFALID
jgi:hypothetical protein